MALLIDIVLVGVVLGGMYALVAMGLTLQYGVARIMNLSHGESLIAAAFGGLWGYTAHAVSPLLGLIAAIPLGFAINWLTYQIVLLPLVKRAKNRGMLEVDSILATFGLLFIVQGVMLVLFGGQFNTMNYLSVPVTILGSTLALNRLIALGFALAIGALLYLALTRTRQGTAIRAVAVDPVAAQLVAIDVRKASAFAFALGGALASAGGVLIAMFTTFTATMGVVFTMKALIVIIMGGVGNVAGAVVAGLMLGLAETAVARLVDPGLTIAVTYALFLTVLLWRPTGLFGEARALSTPVGFALGALVIALLAGVPLVASGYQLALAISLLYFTVLATAWALFSGPTHYISLATVAFFGIGAYTVAVLGEVMPWPAVLAIAGLVGIAVALVVGLSTLRLSGIYFVIFTFGLSELIRQVVSWYEINIHRSVGRYIFLSITTEQIYWQLLALVALVFLAGWAIGRSRLGLALRVIGNDETVARHAGIDTTLTKLAVFAISALFMTLTGAVMAPRWTYIDPNIAFSPMLSFEVVIMALLGGAAALFGPVLGAVPLVLLFEVLTAKFPTHFSILLGIVFVLIVYAVPRGVIGLLKLPPRQRDTGNAAPAVIKADGAPLAVEGVRRTFGGLVAVDGLSFEVNRGEIVGLIGPNGSGKTTVLNLISGALVPDAGAIRFKGRDLARTSAHRIARLGIARTFQLVRVLESMTVLENVMVGLAFGHPPMTGAAAERAAAGLLARVGLGGQGDLPTGQLTYIDQKRLELARALATGPDLLLLDEWLAGLNPTELAEGIALIRSLRDSGVTIILVEHVMDAIRSLCDRCIVMNVGKKIAEGPPAAVLADKEVVRAYLGGADA